MKNTISQENNTNKSKKLQNFNNFLLNSLNKIKQDISESNQIISELKYLNKSSSNNNIKRGRKGLLNKDNSNVCYMNSAFQILSNTYKLRNYFIKSQKDTENNLLSYFEKKLQKNSESMKISEKLSDLFYDLWDDNNKNNIIDPSDLIKVIRNSFNESKLISQKKNSISQLSKSTSLLFAPNLQNDSFYFLIKLLIELHKENNRKENNDNNNYYFSNIFELQKNENEQTKSKLVLSLFYNEINSIIYDLFIVQIKKTTYCQKLKKKNVTFENNFFVDFCEFLPDNEKVDSLENLISINKKGFIKKDKCYICHGYCNYIKSVEIYNFSYYIIFKLPRIKNDQTKNNDIITFNEKLDLYNYIERENINDKLKIKYKCNFNLYGVISHIGNNINQGHYYSSVKNNDEWIRYNDDKVSNENLNDLINNSKDAYVLFYENDIQKN